MNVKISPDWADLLKDQFESTYFHNLVVFTKNAYSSGKCFPPGKEIFAAFDACPISRLRVIILGQDPYHGEGQAHGLCFSVNEGIAHPPSLRNIFLEIEKDIGTPYPKSGNLTRWAEQGVLLLNSTLTVGEGNAGSHQGKGWEKFTDSVIEKVSERCEGVVFLLWGSYAKRKTQLINTKKHFVLSSGHPSPLSANKGLWFGNKHFSKSNDYIVEQGKTPINW